MATVSIGGKTVTVEEFNGRKSTTAITLLRYISKRMPNLSKEWGDFVREYEATHSVELDRVQAQQRFGSRPLVQDGEPVYKRDPETGKETDEFVMIPSFLDRMSEADWEKAGNKLRIPQSPSAVEIGLQLFPDVFDAAQEYVLKLLALLVTPNEVVNQKGRAGDKELDKYLHDKGQDLLDQGMLEELMELAVVGGETITDQYARKAEQLGGRLGNALRLVGIKWNPTSQTEATTGTTTSEAPSSSSSTSSTDSPKPTDGTSEPSSTEPAGESSPVSSAV